MYVILYNTCFILYTKPINTYNLFIDSIGIYMKNKTNVVNPKIPYRY